MQELLLDTDMLSEVWKRRNSVAVSHAAVYLSFHSSFTFSVITKYEVLRGLKQRSAKVQEAQIATFSKHARILDVDDLIAQRAAQLWADAITLGEPAEDADVLIAATALEINLPLCTGNTDHFFWIPGLRLVNWRLP